MMMPVFFEIPLLLGVPDAFGGVGVASGSPAEFDDRQKSDQFWPLDLTYFRCFELCYCYTTDGPTTSPRINVQSIDLTKITNITNRDIIEGPTWYSSSLRDIARITC